MSKELLVPEVITDKPIIPEVWDYDKSVKKVKGLLEKKENLIKETCRELKIGKNKAIEILEQKKRMIYFIQATNGSIKIGSCIDIKIRMQTLQTGSPLQLTLIGLFYEEKNFKEKEIQKQFNYCHNHGEWFSPDKNLIIFLERKKNEVK